MGLFGFFATMVGLGAMTKDAISDSITASHNYEKARSEDKPYYFGSGSKIYSTKTGVRASKRMDWDTNHEWLVNMRTGEKIEDLTARRNNKLDDENIREAKNNGCVFYLTHEFDEQNHKSNDIYKSTIMPGYFRKNDWGGLEERIFIYTKGELVDGMFGKGKRVDVFNSEVKYFEDGAPYSTEEFERRSNELSKKKAIKMGWRFYKVWDKNLRLSNGYKDIETGEWYWISNTYHGYQKATINEQGFLEVIDTEPIYDKKGNILREARPEK